MKLSERFDRRYQQTPTVPVPAGAPPSGTDGAVTVAPAERRVVSRDGASASAGPDTEQLHTIEPSALLSPALAAAKAEIHAQLLSRHAAAIDINNRAGIRRLLMQLTEDHFRSKPPAALVTAIDKERLVEILFDEVIGLGPLEALLRDPEVSEIMVNRPEQIFVERRGRIELTSLAFEDEDSLRRVIDRIVSTIGRRVDESEPMCDARLKDGSRVKPEFGSVWLSMSGPDQAHARIHTTIAVPGATSQSMGLPDNPGQGGVWIMNAGTTTAHLMTPGS